MKVEVFIPTFNRAKKLERAITSVLNQTYPDVGVCVLDNHSSDDTSAVVERMMLGTSRIRCVRHSSNIGMVANFNQVRTLVKSEFFSVLTDDDEYESCFVATTLACFAKHPDLGFAAGNAPTRFGEVITKSQLDHWREGYYVANTQNLRCVLGHYPLITNCLFRAAVAPDFHFRPELGNIGDSLLLICLFAKYDVYVSKVVTGYWNNDGANSSALQKFEPVRHVDISVNELRFYRQFCNENGIAMRALFLLKLKLFLITLLAADRSDFALVAEQSQLREVCNRTMIGVMRMLAATHLVRLVTWTLAALRRANTRWVAWRERSGST